MKKMAQRLVGRLHRVFDKEASLELDNDMIDSPFAAEMGAYAIGLQSLSDNRDLAEKQLYMHTAAGDWLDYWGRSYFGIRRYEGEVDEDYVARVIHEIIRPNQNNVALEILVKKALGVDVRLRDASAHLDELPLEKQIRAPGRFILEMSLPNNLSVEDAQILMSRVYAIVRRHKAAGTEFMEGGLEDQNSIDEPLGVEEQTLLGLSIRYEESFIEGPIKYGSGWRYGTPGVVYGTNAPIQEQIYIKTVNADTAEVVDIQMHGG